MIIFYQWSGAQNILQGKVTDINDDALPYVNVVAMNMESRKIITYAITNTKGEFSLEINETDQVILEFSSMGFKKKEVLVEKNQKNLQVILEEETFRLKEVEVVAKELKDTVDLDLEKLNLTQNSTLRDILKKNDGMEVSDNGAIMIDGKPINKILVNKKEVFINQNNIALDNITNDMIKGLQIINNYKNQFDIEFANRKTSVINIETKDAFKGIMKFDANANYGYKNKYLGRLKGMYFSDELNAFASQNTNNVLNREAFSDEIFNNDTEIKLSNTFTNIINTFEADQNLGVSRDFFNGTSITLRRNFQNAKISAVVYLNNGERTFEISRIRRDSEEQLLNEETNQNNNQANLVSTDVTLDLVINQNSVITNRFNTVIGNKNIVNTTEQLVFSPNENISAFEDMVKTNTIGFSNKTLYKYLINSKSIFTSELQSLHETSSSKLESDFESSLETDSLSQQIDIKNQQIILRNFYDYKIKNLLNLIVGLNYYKARDHVLNETSLNTISTERKVRNDSWVNGTLIIRGDNDRLNYFISLAPTYREIDLRSKKSFRYLPANISLDTKIGRNKNINLSFANRYDSQNIAMTLDTIVNSFNNVFLSDSLLNFTLKKSTGFNAQYRSKSIAKSSYLSTNISITQQKNTIQRVFESVQNNTLLFQSFLIPTQVIYNSSIYGSKGFYFSENLHKISLRSLINYTFYDSETLLNNQQVPLETSNLQYRFTSSFEPQNWFFNEMNISLTYNKNIFYLDDDLLNEQKDFISYFEIIGEKGKVYYDVRFILNFFNSDGTRFSRKDVDFDTRFQIKDDLYITLRSSSLLTLFNIVPDNISSLNISTNEGISQQTLNPNILGFLIAGLQFKF
ncbi:carboxypeptidase-like regulatory domain-containing protein [Ascidiimonas aurantiaca]|uniref:carboxypeptidase-like regulatory domain-containing protein n=1 Tax=Ascidiimonas aurantiaca TaxID=1685432 RepID=UPI0030EBA9D7